MRCLIKNYKYRIPLSEKKKTKVALNYNTVPIIYVSEKIKGEEFNVCKEVLVRSIVSHIDFLSLKNLCRIIVAYRTSSSMRKEKILYFQYIQHIHSLLRLIIKNYDKKVAENIKIIYCENITALKIKKIIGLKDIDGIQI